MAAIRYGRSLYEGSDAYEVHSFRNHEEWLKGRGTLRGVGGSDSSAALGRNPWKTNRELWLEKTGRKQAPDISDNKAVRYGSAAEEYVRRIFQLDEEDRYEVQYKDSVILQSTENPVLLFSPDGLLIEKETGRRGIFEAKTTTVASSMAKERWSGQIPENYYIQVLHGLAVTGFDFAVLRAHLKYNSEQTQIRTYWIERADCEDDISAVVKGVTDFWKDYVETDAEPPLILRGLWREQ